MTALKKPKNHPLPIHSADVKRVQAVINGQLDSKWVSQDEIDAVRDLVFDAHTALTQTHLGSLVLH
jgi:hypothetical protein